MPQTKLDAWGRSQRTAILKSRIDGEDLDPDEVGDLGALAGASSGLLGADDAAAVAAIMQPDARALVLVYENLWSLPFAQSARRAGGQLIANGHIPTEAIVAALDELED